MLEGMQSFVFLILSSACYLKGPSKISATASHAHLRWSFVTITCLEERLGVTNQEEIEQSRYNVRQMLVAWQAAADYPSPNPFSF